MAAAQSTSARSLLLLAAAAFAPLSIAAPSAAGSAFRLAAMASSGGFF
jgi:hypothetical protein